MENLKFYDRKVFVYTCSVVAAILFGMSFIATTAALHYVEPVQLMAYRWLLAMVVYLFLMVVGVVKVSFRGKPVKYLILLSLMQPFLYAIFETYGIKMTTASESAIILALVPSVVILLSVTVLKKKISLRVVFFVALSLIGVITTVVFAPDFGVGGKAMGYLILLGAVFSGAIYTLMGSRFSAEFTPAEITFGMVFMGGVGFNLLYFFQGYTLVDYATAFTNIKLLAPLLYLAVCCSILCFFLCNFVLSRMPAPLASTIQLNIMTVTGMIGGYLVFNDPMPWYKLLGVALIIIGVIGSNREEPQPIAEMVDEPNAI